MLLSTFQTTRKNRSTLSMFRHFGALGLFGLAILDSTPLPTFGGPDILLVILVVSHRNPWYEYATTATLGSAIGAYLTFRLAQKAGKAYLEKKFGGRRTPRLLEAFDRWGTSLLVASTAIPLPMPTSLFFAAAGASGSYRTTKFMSVVTLSRAFRYASVAIIANLYGRHMIRVLRHPTQYWGWLLLFSVLFVALIISGVLLNRRVAESEASSA